MSFFLRAIAVASSSRSILARTFIKSTHDATSMTISVRTLTRASTSINSDPDGWWRTSQMNSASPGDHYSGRSVPVTGRKDLSGALRVIFSSLARTGVKRDVRLSEYYERPGRMRQRKASERHRRRFQEMVRSKVQLVQMMRNRG